MQAVLVTLEPRFQNSTALVKPKAYQKIQILRGVAAFAVVWNHIGKSGYLDSSYKLDTFFVPSGHLRPLLFFMLSGYLIGLSNRNPLASWSDAMSFVKKRLLRLYPIYVLVVLGIFLTTYEKFTFWKLISHMLFMQNVMTTVVGEGENLWSMNYEVFFYLAFIPISLLRIKPYVITLLSLGTGLFLIFMHFEIQILTSYCFRMLFFSIGLWVTNLKSEEKCYPTSFFISLLILLFCHEKFEVGMHFLNMLNTDSMPLMIIKPHETWVALTSVESIPLCLLILCSFSARKLSIIIPVTVSVFAPPIIRIIFLVCHHRLEPGMLFPALLFATSFAFLIFPFNINLGIFKKFFSFLGSVSYGVYLTHFPIIFIFLRFMPFSGSLLTALVRLISYLVVVLATSYFLEKHYQKIVAGIFNIKR